MKHTRKARIEYKLYKRSREYINTDGAAYAYTYTMDIPGGFN